MSEKSDETIELKIKCHTWCKETEDLLRIFALIAVFVCIIGVALSRSRHLEKELDTYKNAPADTVTVVKVDTLLIAEPKIEYRYVKEKEYVEIADTTVIYDTVTKLIQLPREYLVYKDTTYRAVVSGVQPRLDSLEIYRPTITQTITKTIKKKTRWGIGPQVGLGYNGKDVMPYVGIGVQYNLITW